MTARRSSQQIPRLCLHKTSGRAYADFGGRVVYFGKWGTPESISRFEQQLAEAARAPRAEARTELSRFLDPPPNSRDV